VLVKAGILPGDGRWGMGDGSRAGEPASSQLPTPNSQLPTATLTDNASGRFECRWVQLAADPGSRCAFTQGIDRPIEVPVAHGEGRFVARDPAALQALRDGGQVALRYVAADGTGAAAYPDNPNGSDDAIAGVCNPAGNVLGLMPHPEDAILPHQHPRWTREPWRAEGDGLALFRNAVRYASSI